MDHVLDDLLREAADRLGGGCIEACREAAWLDLLGAPAAVGESPAAQALRRGLPAAARSDQPLYLAGEPGTGRRFVAAAAHRLGPRAAAPFVAEDLAALPEELQESELFGAPGGRGLIEEAAEGTLYLASIERLTAACQQRLLEQLPAGDAAGAARGPRLVTSSGDDLEAVVGAGRFSPDLAVRLRSETLRVAPLRERAEDIPAIAGLLVRRRALAAGVPAPELAPDTLELLKTRTWAGNVRELDAELARAASGKSVLRPSDFASVSAPSAAPRPAAAGGTLREAVGDLESTMIEQALAGTNWNKSRAARELGLSRLGLQKKIDRYGIDRRR